MNSFHKAYQVNNYRTICARLDPTQCAKVLHKMYILFLLRKNTIENRKLNFSPEYGQYEENKRIQNCSLQ